MPRARRTPAARRYRRHELDHTASLLLLGRWKVEHAGRPAEAVGHRDESRRNGPLAAVHADVDVVDAGGFVERRLPDAGILRGAAQRDDVPVGDVALELDAA